MHPTVYQSILNRSKVKIQLTGASNSPISNITFNPLALEVFVIVSRVCVDSDSGYWVVGRAASVCLG